MALPPAIALGLIAVLDLIPQVLLGGPIDAIVRTLAGVATLAAVTGFAYALRTRYTHMLGAPDHTLKTDHQSCPNCGTHLTPAAKACEYCNASLDTPNGT